MYFWIVWNFKLHGLNQAHFKTSPPPNFIFAVYSYRTHWLWRMHCFSYYGRYVTLLLISLKQYRRQLETNISFCSSIKATDRANKNTICPLHKAVDEIRDIICHIQSYIQYTTCMSSKFKNQDAVIECDVQYVTWNSMMCSYVMVKNMQIFQNEKWCI